MRFYQKYICLALLMCFLSAPVFAETAQPDVPAPIQNLVASGAQLRYLGQDYGLNGWLVLKNGQEQYFYSTPDGQAVMMGILFNNKGDTVTLKQINELRKKEGPAIDKLAGFDASPLAADGAKAPAQTTVPTSVSPDFTNPEALLKSAVKPKSEQLFDGVEASNWIKLGADKAPVIYTFIDPECPHCHDLIQNIRKSGYLEQGLLQLRLIPVGVLTENSLTEAAYLLASPDPQKDLYRHLDGEKNVLLVDKNVNTQGVQRNIKLMQDWKLDVTPFSVYRGLDGKVKILQGVPDDLKKIITELR
jgi:thiol:disulfide interchange protein DsbG